MVALEALRGDNSKESRVSPGIKKMRRSGRSRTPEATRVSRDEIALIAEGAVLPEGVTDIRMTAVHTHGEKLPNGDWRGIGGRTQFGPVWVIGGRLDSPPIHLFDHMKDALELHRMLRGEEGELWQRKQRRLDAIAAAEAAEEAASAISRENAKTVARAERRGDGSHPPSSSSEKRTASSGRGMSRRDRLRKA